MLVPVITSIFALCAPLISFAQSATPTAEQLNSDITAVNSIRSELFAILGDPAVENSVDDKYESYHGWYNPVRWWGSTFGSPTYHVTNQDGLEAVISKIAHAALPQSNPSLARYPSELQQILSQLRQLKEPAQVPTEADYKRELKQRRQIINNYLNNISTNANQQLINLQNGVTPPPSTTVDATTPPPTNSTTLTPATSTLTTPPPAVTSTTTVNAPTTLTSTTPPPSSGSTTFSPANPATGTGNGTDGSLNILGESSGGYTPPSPYKGGQPNQYPPNYINANTPPAFSGANGPSGLARVFGDYVSFKNGAEYYGTDRRGRPLYRWNLVCTSGGAILSSIASVKYEVRAKNADRIPTKGGRAPRTAESRDAAQQFQCVGIARRPVTLAITVTFRDGSSLPGLYTLQLPQTAANGPANGLADLGEI
jgi:hypothetical protein